MFVFLLRPAIGATDDQARRFVQHLHGGIGRVDALSTGAGCPANGNLQFLRLELHIDFLRFRQHGDGRRARVDAALRFGRRHALDAMHSAFVFEPLENVLPAHVENDFLETAQVRRAGVERLRSGVDRRRLARLQPERSQSPDRRLDARLLQR